VPQSISEKPPESPGAWTLAELTKLMGFIAACVALTLLLWDGIERGLGGSASLASFLDLARGVSTSLVTALAVGWAVNNKFSRRTERLHNEIELAQQEARKSQTTLEAVIEHTPAGLWILDEHCGVVLANKTARKIHGCTAPTIDHFPCQASKTGLLEFACNTCPTKHTLVHAEPTKEQGYRTDPVTGEVVTVETYPIILESGEPCAVVVEKVVTEQQKLQALMLHQEKMAAFGLLAAGVAHDLGNPLSGIEMHLQLLQEEALPDEAGESVDTVRREVTRMRRTLRELVDFARRRRAEASLVSVRSVIDDALRLLRYDHRMRGVEIRVDADPQAPAVYMVEDHLMQIALNLLINALDAMPDGGDLRLEIQSVDEGVALRIHDSGTGMTREELERCCDPLYTTKPEGRGTGLGLSMSKDILEAAGGELELHSAPKKGTTVVVTLPAAPDEIAPTGPVTVDEREEGQFLA